MECPRCHQPVESDDLFCAECGHPLWQADPAVADDERTPPSLPFPLPTSTPPPVPVSAPQEMTLPDAATHPAAGTGAWSHVLQAGAPLARLVGVGRWAGPLALAALLLAVTAAALATAAHSAALARTMSLAATASAATASAAEVSAQATLSASRVTPTIDVNSLPPVSSNSVQSDAATQFAQANASADSITDWNAPVIYTPQAAPGGTTALDDSCVGFAWSNGDDGSSGAQTMELMYQWDAQQQAWAFDFANVLSTTTADCAGYTPYSCHQANDPNCQTADADSFVPVAPPPAR